MPAAADELRNTQTGRLARAAFVFVSLAVLASVSRGESGDRILYFVDEHGVPHFSNVPADPRYRPLNPGSALSSLPSPSGAAPVSPLNAAPLPVPEPSAESGDAEEADVPTAPDGPGESDDVERSDSANPGRNLWGRH
jgi:hypothetical protein